MMEFQVEDKWSENHCKLVYLISRWGRSALSPEEKESWLRQVGGAPPLGLRTSMADCSVRGPC